MKNDQIDLDALYESLNYYYGEGSEGRTGKVVEEKNIKMQAGIRLPFDDLADNFKPEGVELIMRTGGQFPGHSLTAFLYQFEDSFYRILSTLELRVSLLSKYFTIFYCQSLLFKGLLPTIPSLEGINRGITTGRKRPTFLNVISNINDGLDNEGHNFNLLMNQSYKYFPDYKFIDPMILFETPVPGLVPHGSFNTDPSSNSLYSFLFGFAPIGKITTVNGKRHTGPLNNVQLYPPDFVPGFDLTQDEE